ncbi:hypothetical protein DCCM_1014 [Desulfocucumis palustris]|uniref:Uncharacterized protein n=1 Tax=Desulfocucumis palustris TaxID=1898651 RepID=A0A2L2X9K3_9FIRM|nr:hypothetical protein [Desulfocucumis palustris]GBF32818.1 hypothetical protein DCCM_1014 [Desulfocucumis palustris]
MRELIRKLVKDNSGMGTFWGILALGTVMIIFVAAIRLSHMVTGADIDLQEAVADACKAAAQQVEPRSEADGYPLIETEKAHDAFRYVLALNLNLDETTLEPRANSMVKNTPGYNFIVYNGFDYYEDETYIGGPGGELASTGAKAYTQYIFSGGALSRDDSPDPGFIPNLPGNWPRTFNINNAGGSMVFRVELPNCGVVAVVNADLVEVLGKDPVNATRWASAALTCNGGTCSIPSAPEPPIQ